MRHNPPKPQAARTACQRTQGTDASRGRCVLNPGLLKRPEQPLGRQVFPDGKQSTGVSAKAPSRFQGLRRSPQSILTALDKLPREGRDWFKVLKSAKKSEAFFSAVLQTSSPHIESRLGGLQRGARGSSQGWHPLHSHSGQGPHNSWRPSGSHSSNATLSALSGLIPGLTPPAHHIPGSQWPPKSPPGYHAGGAASRGHGALRAPSAPPPEACGVSGVYSCRSAAAGLSRVLGRRSAPDSGSNCGPGVRQPSSRGRRPDRDALERRPGTRGAEERPRQARQRSARAPERRPWRRPRTPLRSCPSAAEACADVASVRSAVAAVAPARVRGSSFRALPGGGPQGCGVLCARGPPGGQLTDLPKP